MLRKLENIKEELKGIPEWEKMAKSVLFGELNQVQPSPQNYGQPQ